MGFIEGGSCSRVETDEEKRVNEIKRLQEINAQKAADAKAEGKIVIGHCQ